ncbi:hypothetical protein, partial [Roseisolibacter sp. H3M3-2]|uniref:hypothetical protein n=1 Tax=Roseisolibacter sp. H3M3-2 TaxID=3031323 RepID=UPI0023DCB158
RATAALEGALLDAPAIDAASGDAARFRPRVAVRPWEGAPGAVDEISATVTLPDGTPFTLRRLVRRAAGARR